MKYVKLGRTGLDVSRLCLGCMTYGAPDKGSHPWSLGEEDSRPFIRKAVDIWRCHQLLAVGAEISITEIIRDNEDDVRR